MSKMDTLKKDARQELDERVNSDYSFDKNAVSEVISEIAYGQVPVYTRDLLELCEEDYGLLHNKPEMETDGDPESVIKLNVFEEIETDLWEYWNDELEDALTKMEHFIQRNGITAKIKRVDRNPNMDDEGGHMTDHWHVVMSLMRHGKVHRFSVYFSQGSGFQGKAPEVDDVLDCVASDTCGYDAARGFEDWCDDYGYDSCKAEKTYKVIGSQLKRLKTWLGDEAANYLMYEVERL